MKDCVVKYVASEDSNTSKWLRLCCAVKRRDSDVVKLVIMSLEPDTSITSEPR